MAKPSLPMRAWTTFAVFIAVLGLAIFACAGTLDYWRAWVFLAAFATPSAVITAYLLSRDPALAEKRMRGGSAAETRPQQKLVQAINFPLFLALFLLPGLARRWGVLDLPAWASVAGDVLVVVGYLGFFWVLAANPFAAGTVELSDEHAVISTGPYRFVRHPMYLAGLVLIGGVALALGWSWALIPAGALTVGIIWRLVDEERFLSASLPGYEAYRAKTRHRLIPGLF